MVLYYRRRCFRSNSWQFSCHLETIGKKGSVEATLMVFCITVRLKDPW